VAAPLKASHLTGSARFDADRHATAFVEVLRDEFMRLYRETRGQDIVTNTKNDSPRTFP